MSRRRGLTEANNIETDPTQCSWLWREVPNHNPDAFNIKPSPPPPSQGPLEGHENQNQEREKHFEHVSPNFNNMRKEHATLDLVDETPVLLRKLQFSTNAIRT
ncbi:hypothetical protein E2562_031338 [Oryza meyeriana var. granulata]|uniref:Uncharacterized protein n=1 Tax=Oryza meyeriana var. granulata TaxID=110450 RepID=A0A6G1D8P1_9ORYZ|nr:hypothetical protein E2562_031338 [Oryza meyeriana var. granulata]